MQTKILNFIIIFSFAGIVSLLAKDYFFPSKTANEIVISPTPTVVVIEAKKTQNDEPLAPCTNRYFNFQKGTTWKYRLVSELDANKNKNKIDKTFVNTIIDTTPTSITIETTYSPEKNTKKTVVTCKQTGVHGMPFPYLEEGLLASSEGQLSLLNNVSFKPTLLLPPQDKLVAGGAWQNPIDLKLPIPFFDFQISLDNKVINVSEQQLYGMKRSVIDIESKFDTKNLPVDILKKATDQNISSQFAENIGLIKSDLSLNLGSIAKIKSLLQLLEFKQASTSGLPKLKI